MVSAAKKREKEREREQKKHTRYGVFVWRGDGRYRATDAIKVYKSAAAAQKHVDRLYDAGETQYVVRSFTVALPRANPSRGGTSRYIYPAEKHFPVGDVEHERRALAYVAAGRGTPEQIVHVPAWLAKHARDADVKAEAKAAVKAWRSKGKGAIAQGLRAIRSRARKARARNPGSINVLVTPTRQGWSLEPAGAGPYYAYGRRLLLEAAATAPAGRAAHAVELMAARGPLVTLRSQKAMEEVARKAHVGASTIGALESGAQATIRMPMRLWRRLLSNETGLRV